MRNIATILFLLGCGASMVLAARVPVPGTVELSSGPERLAVWFDAVGPWFVLAFLVTCAGALLSRRVQAEEARAAGEGDAQSVQHALAAMRTRLDELGDDTETWSHSLGELLEEDIPRLLEQRERLIAERGLAWFAEVIGAFARFERNVARAWSALTDGSPAEARASVARARRAITQAESLASS